MAAKGGAMKSTRTRVGLALAVALAGLWSAAWAQDVSAADDTLDLIPPDMSTPASEQEYRTCPDREPRPAWIDELKGFKAVRALLVSEIYKARTYEAIIATGDCSCAVKAPPWDAAEAEYLEAYAALDRSAVGDALGEFQRLSGSLHQDARRICTEQGNW